jgi:hypothetical protein
MTIDEHPILVKRLNRTFHERGDEGPHRRIPSHVASPQQRSRAQATAVRRSESQRCRRPL